MLRWIEEVVAPTLLLQGDLDRLVRWPRRERVASLRPDWEYHEFAGAGHVPMLEVPGEFVEVVERLAERGRVRPSRVALPRRALGRASDEPGGSARSAG